MKPLDESCPAGEISPAEQGCPAEEAKQADEGYPAEEAIPTEEDDPIGEPISFHGGCPSDEAKSAEKGYPAEEATPCGESYLFDEATPADGYVVEEVTPPEGNFAEDATHIEGYPVEGICPPSALLEEGSFSERTNSMEDSPNDPPPHSPSLQAPIEESTLNPAGHERPTVALKIIHEPKLFTVVVSLESNTKSSILTKAQAVYLEQVAKEEGTAIKNRWDYNLLSVRMDGHEFDLSFYDSEDLTFLIAKISQIIFRYSQSRYCYPCTE